MSPADGSEVLGAAADYRAEKAAYGEFMFPKLFARIAQLYHERFGLTDRQLSAVAMKNRAHAKLNPLAQTRSSALTWELCLESGDNPRLAPPLKITDCSQISDGAAAILLCSESFAKRLESRPKMRLAGFGHTTDHLALSRKDPPDFPMARRAADTAYTMARLKPRDLSGAEIHDCFSISEIIATEALGLAPPGQGKTLAEQGFTDLPRVRESLGLPKPAWSIPVNPGGGLIGDGHPVGATGVRQVHEIFQHLSRRAADRQIDGAKHMLAFNMGGSVTTVVVSIWEGV
jgi:acetyl-CoA C-acetyltransferase